MLETAKTTIIMKLRNMKEITQQRKFKNTSKIFLAVFAVGFVFYGPSLVWKFGNLPGLIRDIREMFDKSDVKIPLFYCHMVGMTRDGTCSFHASNAQVQKLVHALKLHDDSANLYDSDTQVQKLVHALKLHDGSVGLYNSDHLHECNCSLPLNKRIRVYEVRGRPEELKFRSACAFEYLELYQHTASDEVCLYFSYAYG